MKLNILLVAFCATLFGSVWVVQTPSTHAQARTDGISVSATAYTCDVHPRNPMSGCSRLRWGGSVNNPGMACPVSWRNRRFEVDGFGTLRCDDTGRYDTWNGLPHIDIRFDTWEQTRDWGVRKITIFPSEANGSSAATASTIPGSSSAPAASTTALQDPLAAAKAAVPRGDATTAVVRRTRFDTALQSLPWLGDVVTVSNHQSLWLVTLWQPRDLIPAQATPLPNGDEPIATTLVILNADTGAVVSQTYITMDALNAIGALPQSGAQ